MAKIWKPRFGQMLSQVRKEQEDYEMLKRKAAALDWLAANAEILVNSAFVWTPGPPLQVALVEVIETLQGATRQSSACKKSASSR